MHRKRQPSNGAYIGAGGHDHAAAFAIVQKQVFEQTDI
jgi:hypothetical protein